MDATIGEFSPSVERSFESEPCPGFWGQVTLRSMAVAVVLGFVFCLITLRIHMRTGIVGALNMPANILSFFILKNMVGLLRRYGIAVAPFTRQENIFLQTCVITCVNIALTGGFATNIVAMNSEVAKTLVDNPDPRDIVDHISIGQYILYLSLTGLAGIMLVIPLMKAMIVDYRLLFPSGTVVAQLVNTFHTPQGAYVAKLQVATITKAFVGSFSWAVFQWFYTGGGDCGFQAFPMFGLELYKRRFFFDFSATYVGLGLIIPYIISFGLLFGAIISWGVLYPFLESKKGQWYLTDSPTSLNGLNGYKVFIGVTMIITEGIFNFVTLVTASLIDLHKKRNESDTGISKHIIKNPSLNYDDRKRLEVFFADQIPAFGPIAGYVVIATICTIAIPWIFNHIKFYHVAAVYTILPVFTFCNMYGTGLTDWSVAPTYGKFMIFVTAAWIAEPGAVVASLVACGITMAALNVSSQAMGDLKSGYLTLTSPRSVVAGHIYGVIIGSIINPCIFLLFQANAKGTAPIGSKDSEYPCPAAGVYRAIGLIGRGGVKELPDYCVAISFITFFITLSVETLRLVSQRKDWKLQYYIPCTTTVALPFFTGATFTIDMSLGSVLLFIWTKVDRQSAGMLASAIAAGLICGDGIWYLPTAILSIFNVQPPICMKFIASGKQVEVVDSFLSTLQKQSK
ncbi:hypothetical protein ACP70R_034648 [Stipagrostis hirtigluma subsp. patula]